MILPRVINDLCRFPKWLVDNLVLTKDQSLTVDGWALADHGDLMIGEIAMNGRKPDVFYRVPSPSIAKIFPGMTTQRWQDSALCFTTSMSAQRKLDHFLIVDVGRSIYSTDGRMSTFPYGHGWTRHMWSPIHHGWLLTQGSTKFMVYVMVRRDCRIHAQRSIANLLW